MAPEWLSHEYELGLPKPRDRLGEEDRFGAWIASFQERDGVHKDGPWQLLCEPSQLVEDPPGDRLRVAAAPLMDGAAAAPAADRDAAVAPTGLEQTFNRARAQNIVKDDIWQYTLVWEELQANAAERRATVELEQLLVAANADCPDAEPRQPADGDPTTPQYLEHLEAAFAAVDDGLYAEAERIAAAHGLEFKKGPHKKGDRCMEKALLCYGGDFSRLKDLRRCSIVCPTMAAVLAACRGVVADPAIDVLRVKNRFAPGYPAKEQSAGYRDVQFNIGVPGTGLVWELQVHVAAIETLKSTMPADPSGRTGHERYKAFRDVMERLPSHGGGGIARPPAAAAAAPIRP